MNEDSLFITKCFWYWVLTKRTMFLNLNKNSYLCKAACSNCNKRLVNKDKLSGDKKAALTLLNCEHLAHTCKHLRTRKDIPYKCCTYLAFYVDLRIEST